MDTSVGVPRSTSGSGTKPGGGTGDGWNAKPAGGGAGGGGGGGVGATYRDGGGVARGGAIDAACCSARMSAAQTAGGGAGGAGVDCRRVTSSGLGGREDDLNGEDVTRVGGNESGLASSTAGGEFAGVSPRMVDGPALASATGRPLGVVAPYVPPPTTGVAVSGTGRMA